MSDPYPYLPAKCQDSTCGHDTCTHYRSRRCVTGECNHGAEGVDCTFTPAPGSIFGAGLSTANINAPLPSLTWVSMPYGGSGTHAMDGLTGPDIRHTCETPRCATTAVSPIAHHLEMLWDSTDPGMPTVARAWKTCEACHASMKAGHQSTGPDDADDAEDAEDEWRPGTCDMCTGHVGGQDELRAAMASAIVPVCACAIGEGAPAGKCQCGPVPFETEQLPDDFAELVDELSRPIVSDNGVVIPPAMSPPAEVQPQTAAEATAETDPR